MIIDNLDKVLADAGYKELFPSEGPSAPTSWYVHSSDRLAQEVRDLIRKLDDQETQRADQLARFTRALALRLPAARVPAWAFAERAIADEDGTA